MKVTVYLRVAPGPRGPKIAASTKPNYAPLTTGAAWTEKALPTVSFAVRFVIPDSAFGRATAVLGEIEVPDERIEVAAVVAEPDA